MSSNASSNRFLGACIVESVRVTIIGVRTGPPLPIFKSLTEIEPEEQLLRPADSSMQEAGRWNGQNLSIASNPQRIDLVLGDIPTANVVNPTAPFYKRFYNIGSFSTAEATVRRLGRRLLAESPSTIRVAFAPIMIVPAQSQAEANIIFKRALGIGRIDADVDTGLIWQEVKPARSQYFPLEITRFSSWQTLGMAEQTISPSTFSMSFSPALTKWAVRVQFDYNFGQPDGMFISKESLLPAFEELLDLFKADLGQYDND